MSNLTDNHAVAIVGVLFAVILMAMVIIGSPEVIGLIYNPTVYFSR